MMERTFETHIWKNLGLEVPKIFIDQRGSNYNVYELRGISDGKAVYASTGITIHDRSELEALMAA